MVEPRSFASLTSGLLARKGAAKPAMRRQYMGTEGNLALGHEDLGWNDMGEEESIHGAGAYQPHAGLSPMPGTHPHASGFPSPVPVAVDNDDADAMPPVEIPAVVEQRQMLADKVANGQIEVAAPKERKHKAAKKPAAVRQRKSMAAFTLRLDPDRHLKLRLACAVANRSAQQLVVEALDNLLAGLPQIEHMANQVPLSRAAGQA